MVVHVNNLVLCRHTQNVSNLNHIASNTIVDVPYMRCITVGRFFYNVDIMAIFSMCTTETTQKCISFIQGQFTQHCVYTCLERFVLEIHSTENQEQFVYNSYPMVYYIFTYASTYIYHYIKCSYICGVAFVMYHYISTTPYINIQYNLKQHGPNEQYCIN